MLSYRISIRIFRAITEPQTCIRYMEQHQNVLKEFGIEMITTNNNKWMNNPGIYAIIAENLENGDLMAGIRIQLARGNQKLPIEEATSHFDPKVIDLVHYYDSLGCTGEITALWNSRKYKGVGLSQLLIGLSTSVLNQLKVTSLLGLCDTRNLETMRLNGGYIIENSIGNKGFFYYPKEGLIAWAIHLKDPEEVYSASETMRELILLLRKNPEINKTVERENAILDIDFKLQIPINELFKL